MPRYNITLRFNVAKDYQVEADDPRGALDKAMGLANAQTDEVLLQGVNIGVPDTEDAEWEELEEAEDAAI